ncbi:spore cortex-lytic enzyme [Clostridium sp. CX1]|uniref:Spore cortex-lytic enzyme n=1 Tax=Clostridium tanneri TaxID=3037988 RepID=A0ABU4JRH0_9CLOT|nr:MULTISPECIES: spore cortex-lytic enzyme [unclassified Clostridium]MCT8975871.1 spore cortex-lytic enzyme [Clostridium sp. CX1]MDW8800727.1 spore cortex-lytic enzyme [Clostridium sp. A1-XYC3]
MKKKVAKFKKEIVCVLAIMITYIITSIGVAPYNNAARAIAYNYGDRGNIVLEIQRRLKAWGYYDGDLDAIYGYRTYTGVRSFQAKHGLAVDGIAGDRTLNALGINAGQYAANQASTTNNSNPGKYTTNNQDVMLLARAINGEARGEPYEGQVAVGAVILNRTRDSRFPSTIAGVVYQPGAFTAVVDGQIHANMEQNSINAARDALNGWDPSGGAVYYFNPATSTNKWIWSRPLIKVIGKHRFCR